MVYIMLTLLVGMVLGVISVASNPSPYFAALGLVLVAGVGCGILMGYGGSFLSLVLFLIYLGGMLVVFAYCAALAAEPYPEAWGEWSVLGSVLGYLLLVLGAVSWFWGGWYEGAGVSVDELVEFSVTAADSGGVALMYSLGGGLLVVSAWVLLLTLFVVLELTRGLARGALRAV
uniref:NADH-ubiquinone oxidoreductase chain 6 n=1 Tax=Brosme brosme TaxID=81638 RepID=A0A8K1NXE0_BROBO|nr:NADH dehydrogenase subunit 6 [Brosme brosme]UDF87764.1 NADH dehydrogenase subunit 6 [Brosme brosme]UDH55004.1 NADH dehydrogenase subunit 6 [Brosme brosme]